MLLPSCSYTLLLFFHQVLITVQESCCTKYINKTTDDMPLIPATTNQILNECK